MDDVARAKKKRRLKPLELSSRVPVSVARPVLGQAKAKGRDPRFDSLSGELVGRTFDREWGFLLDLRRREIEELRKSLNREKNSETRDRIRAALAKAQNELRGAERARDERQVVAENKEKERTLVRSGKKEFYPKRSVIQQQKIESEYERIRSEGGEVAVKKALVKRRKRAAMKDRRLLPGRVRE